MAKPKTTKELKKRFEALEKELVELQNEGKHLDSDAAEGLTRVVKEMRKALTRARENGDIDKL